MSDPIRLCSICGRFHRASESCPAPPGVAEVQRVHGLMGTAPDRLFTLGLFAWLAIVEKEADRLSEGAQNALGLLREDLERLANAR
jgi:hypothetical protein